MRTKLLAAFALASLLSPAAARALNCESTTDGDWTNAATWVNCGGANPGLNDTVEIKVNHTVTVNDAVTAGASPVDATTYNIKVYGELLFENPADSDNSLTAYSSIKVYSGGEIRVGTAAVPMDCAHTAAIVMHTTPGVRYHILVDEGGLFEAHGCPWYVSTAQAPTFLRARIEWCAPNCDAGAIRIHLDRTVDWADVVDVVSAGHGPDVAIGSGGGDALPGCGDNDLVAELSEITGIVSDTDFFCTTTKDHQPGDMIVAMARNVVVYSDSDAQHGAIWTTSTGAQIPIKLSWARVHDMGNATYAAVDHGNENGATGSFDYCAVTRCAEAGADGGHDCFRFNAKTMQSFVGNSVFGSRLDHADTTDEDSCLSISGSAAEVGFEVDDFTCVLSAKCVDASGTGAPISLDAPWLSACGCDAGGFAASGNIAEIADGLILHTMAADPSVRLTGTDYWWSQARTVAGTTFRNACGGALVTQIPSVFIKGNVFDDIPLPAVVVASPSIGGMYLTAPIDATFIGNTYDNCNWADAGDQQGAVSFLAQGGRVHMYGEQFGLSQANTAANLYFSVPCYTTTAGNYVGNSLAFACNDCNLEAPASAPAGWNYGVYFGNLDEGVYAPSWQVRAFIGAGQFLGLQNINKVANANQTFGPGGCLIEHEAAVVRDNSLNLKVTPFATHEWARVPLRRVYVDTGDVLTVSVWLWKMEAFAYPPRLVLMGPGFDPTIKYAAMGAGPIKTWTQVVVTGSASLPGVVYAYLDVRGNLSGVAHAIEPVNPPTAVLYADGIVLVKS
jgi:hypothetical protein